MAFDFRNTQKRKGIVKESDDSSAGQHLTAQREDVVKDPIFTIGQFDRMADSANLSIQKVYGGWYHHWVNSDGKIEAKVRRVLRWDYQIFNGQRPLFVRN